MTRDPKAWRSVGSRKSCSVISTRVSRHPLTEDVVDIDRPLDASRWRHETSRNDRSSIMIPTVLDVHIERCSPMRLRQQPTPLD